MHVAMIANDTTFVYKLRREILEAFQTQGHRVTVMGQATAFAEDLKQAGFAVEDIQTPRRGTNPLQDVILFLQFYRTLKKQKPDIVFTNNIKPNAYGGMVCRILKIPYVANVTGLGTAVEYPGRMQKLTCWLYKLGVAGAKCVFFQNQENETFFRERNMLNPKSKTHLLPGSGVNLQDHPVLPYPKEEKIHFLFIARLLKEKGIEQYLAAAKAIKEKHKDVVFHICGGCDDDRYLEILREMEQQGTVIYHGEQKNMQPFFMQASCIVHPSYYPEGMSNVLLEAAASGRPVIAADRSGCRETVENGVSGYVVPIQDEQAVITAIEKFLQLSWEERRAMGLAGRKKMEKNFDRQIVVQQYLKEVNLKQG